MRCYIIGFLFTGWVLSACSSPEENDHSIDLLTVPPSLDETVRPGVEVVELTEEHQRLLHIETVIVESGEWTFELSGPGLVEASPEGLALISTPVSGIVTAVHAHEGEWVNAGDPLVTMESLAYAELFAEYLEIRAERQWLESEYTRVEQLVREEIRARRDLERLDADRIRMEAREQAARSRLRALGLTAEMLRQRDGAGSGEQALFTLRAPIRGQIEKHEVDLGQSVRPEQTLLEIVDPALVLIRGYLDPEERPWVRVGADMLIRPLETVTRSSGRRIEGRIEAIQPALDAENRSLVVNARLETDGVWPVIGERVRFVVPITTSDSEWMLPARAVQFDGPTGTVYVKRSDTRYERRPVEIERVFEDRILVSGGVNPGDELAVTQLFSLKALLRFELFAED